MALPLGELLISAERRGTAIRNNGGGHYNHSLFWDILAPNAAKTPEGKLADDIKNTFTSLDSLKKLMNAGAALLIKSKPKIKIGDNKHTQSTHLSLGTLWVNIPKANIPSKGP